MLDCFTPGPLKGVNFPINAWNEWKSKNELGEQHKWLDECIALFQKDYQVSYLIASLAGDYSTLYHEWAHAIFHLDEEFRKTVHKMWGELEEDLRIAIKKELTMRNYVEAVFADEFQAYLVEDCAGFGSRWAARLRPCQVQLKRLVSQPALETAVGLDEC